VNRPTTASRDVALGVLVFAATLVLLAGGWAMLSRASSPPTRTPAASGVAAASQLPGGPSAGDVPVGSAGIAPDATQLIPSIAPGPSGEPATVVLTGAGDIAVCDSDGARQTSDQLLAQKTGWFFTVGDNAYENGSDKVFAECYAPTWGRVLDRTILPVPGNHDWLTKGASGYLKYFGARAQPNGTDYYSMDLGAWHIIVLESDCSKVGGCRPDNPQGRWLAQDLAQSTAHCTLAFWHHPRFSSGEHGNNAFTQPLWQDLYDAGADLILDGHDHTYERFAPQTPDGRLDPDRGIVEMVVGTGGRSHYSFSVIRDNSLVRDNSTWGVERLVLADGRWSFEFLPVPGETFSDSGSGSCH